MFYVVTVVPPCNAQRAAPLRIVSGCPEPAQVMKEAIVNAGFLCELEVSEKEPERTEEEKRAAQQLVDTVFRSMQEAAS